MSALQFRKIGVGDPAFEGIVDLRDRVLRDPLGRPSARHERERDAKGEHFAALKDGAVVGCLALHVGGRAAELKGMAVAPDLQREGVGAALYAYAEGWARSSEIDEIFAEARKEALGFYLACGFAAEGEDYMGHGIPHHKVRKRLAL